MKKKFLYSLSLFILLFVVYSCKDDNENPSPNPSLKITIDEGDTHPVISQQGGTVYIPFTATGEWSATMINDRAESWITINPSSGNSGDVELSVTATANETYDERNATIILKCGDDKKEIVVTQKQKDALTVTSSKYEVPSGGGNISVEVKANIEYEVEVKADWIKQIENQDTRALTSNILNFKVDFNDTESKREGEIIIKSGNLSETIKVYQEYEDFITLTQKDFTLPEEGGTVDIEIKSSVGYNVKMPSDANWITEIQSRAVSTHTRHYLVEPNESYDSREAKIIFYNTEDETIADTVSIYQMYKGAILVARNEYQFGVKGGSLNLTVKSNLEFDVTVSDEWIEKIDTRNLTEYNLTFNIQENDTGKDREGIITVKDKNSDKQQTVTIKQSYKDLEREALIALYKATDGDNWTNNENWCSNKPITEWYGISENIPGKLEISLGSNNLKGQLPKEIGLITNLYQLVLWDNQLSGEIPAEIGNLQELTGLHLSNNQFSGNIPDEIWTLPQLKALYLDNNQLSGELSPNIQNAKKLENLGIGGNQFTSLPEEIGELVNLKNLDISNSHFKTLPNSIEKLVKLEGLIADNSGLSGDIPDGIWKLTSLENLSLGHNSLSGHISDKIGNLKNLEQLSIYYNKLEGNIPETIGNLTNLKYLWLNDNNLNGNIPESIGKLSQLIVLSAEKNQLEGSIPETIGNLSQIQDIRLNDNQIRGKLPESIGNLRNIEYFDLGFNQLSGEIPKAIQNLRKVKSFRVWYNNLEHTIPEEFAELPMLEIFLLKNNRLSGAIPKKLIDCPRWNSWAPSAGIFPQQDGYVLYPEGAYTSTDFSKDGEVQVLQKHSKGNGIQLVLMGDMFVDKEMQSGGVYETIMKEAMEGYFSIEPYRSLREYFDVISVKAVSKNDWASGETAFESIYTVNGIESNIDNVAEYVKKALGVTDLINIQTLLIYKNAQAGSCGWRTDSNGSVTSFARVGYYQNVDTFESFAAIIHHEAGGHGFGLLSDEYIIFEGATCPPSEIERGKEIYEKYGFSSNVDYTSDPSKIRWAHFINDPRYETEEIGVFEGSYYQYGIYRATEYSIMRELYQQQGGYSIPKIDQFSAPSREAIYKRVMKLAYGDSWKYDYEEFVKFDAQGHADFVAAKNKAQTRGISNSKVIKHPRPTIYKRP